MTGLDALSEKPDLAGTLSRPSVVSLLTRLGAVQCILAARLAGLETGEADEFLTVEEAAKVWRMTRDSLYNSLHREPYSLALVKRGRRVFFSKRAIIEQLTRR